MQLFKSEWVFEPGAATTGSASRGPRFAPRYGMRRARIARPACPPPVQVTDAPGLSMIEHERAVLRFLASYDRAA